MAPAARLRWFRRACVLVALAAAVQPGFAQAPYETIHEFVQGPGRVHGRLVQAIDGSLYGVTREGGAYGGGTVFVVRRSGGVWMPAVTLHDFRGPEGTQPMGGLIEGPLGVIHGTTTKGGALGGGTVFRFNIFGAFQVLASLNPAVHGAQPIAELTRGPDLNYYGTTLIGGPGGYGTVFRMTPAGALSVLHAFSGPDGAFPAGALGIGLDGHFYGTTFVGGSANRGTVFRITRAGAFTSLKHFGALGMGLPVGRMTLAPDGSLYGAASGYELPNFPGDIAIAGALFSVDVSGVVSEQQVFSGFMGPGAGVTVGRDGSLYGTSEFIFGVYRIRQGVGLEWIADGSVDYAAGETGVSTLIEADDGRLYMGTKSGGIGGYGTVFSTNSTGDIRVHHSFRSDGFHPASSLLLRSGGSMYASTYSGGRSSRGTVFALHPSRVVDTVADVPDGHGNAIGDLAVSPNGLLAPTDRRILELIDGSVSVLSQLEPSGSPVTAWDGAIYAAHPSGAILRVSTGETLYQFTNDDGAEPFGLIEGDGVLYGVTRSGGASNHGTVFKVTLDGTFTTLHHFNGADGKWPIANLAFTHDGTGLVGTTTAGGDTTGSPDGAGTVFHLTFDGTFTLLHTFAPGEGVQPLARLLPASDGRFYGTTFLGGLGFGTVFAVSLDGTFDTVHRFAAGQGAHPYGGVTEGLDGALYGTTVFGGRANGGTLYRLGTPVSLAGR